MSKEVDKDIIGLKGPWGEKGGREGALLMGEGILHRVIMYYIETKAICCRTSFGQFLGSYQTLGGGGGRYF
jgi:hypothetical protein